MKILKKIWNFFELLGRARAAGILAREGLHREAAYLMQNSKVI
jgi:hypothetical protein